MTETINGRLTTARWCFYTVPLLIWIVLGIGSLLWLLLHNSFSFAYWIIPAFLGVSGAIFYFWLDVKDIVTRFRFEDNSLRVSRLGNVSRQVHIAEIVQVDTNGVIPRCSSIYLLDGTTLQFVDAYDHAEEGLLDVLNATCGEPKTCQSGRVNRTALFRSIMRDSATVLSLTFLSGYCLVWWLPTEQDSPLILPLEVITIFGVGLAIHGLVVRKWFNQIRSFQWDSSGLAYQTFFGGKQPFRRPGEVIAVESIETQEQQYQFTITFNDGVRIRFRKELLQNAEALLHVLQRTIVENEGLTIVGKSQCLQHSNPLRKPIASLIDDDEAIWWIGKGCWWKRPSLYFDFITGVPIALCGLYAMVRLFASAWPTFDMGTVLGFGFLSLFSSSGIYLMARSFRFSHGLNQARYAITSRRLLIVNGFTWRMASAPRLDSQDTREINRDEFRGYARNRYGDTFILGDIVDDAGDEEEIRHLGFLHTNDPQGAETALKRFLFNSERSVSTS